MVITGAGFDGLATSCFMSDEVNIDLPKLALAKQDQPKHDLPKQKVPTDTPATGWWLYMIETEKGRLYTGITTDVERRFEQHRIGRGAKFFRTDPPLKLVYQTAFADRSSATKEEIRIKKLSRVKKLALISGGS